MRSALFMGNGGRLENGATEGSTEVPEIIGELLECCRMSDVWDLLYFLTSDIC